MPTRRDLYEQQIADRAREAVEADRARFRANVWTAVQCLMWSGAGLALMAWGLHTTDPTLGEEAFTIGSWIGYGGVLFTLLNAWRKAEKRGDR